MTEGSATGPSTGLYDVGDIATLLKSSCRHVRRLTDSGRMPRAFHVGRLLRWRKAEIDTWIAGGCRPASKARGQ